MTILGLDVSTSCTGLTLLDDGGNVLLNKAIKLNKEQNIFKKAGIIQNELLNIQNFHINKVFIEQTLQSFRAGYSSAQTLSTLSRFNGIVSWLCYSELNIEPDYISAAAARKLCDISVKRGEKAKEIVMQILLDTEPWFAVKCQRTRFGNIRLHHYDEADSFVVAKAGWIKCKKK